MKNPLFFGRLHGSGRRSVTRSGDENSGVCAQLHARNLGGVTLSLYLDEEGVIQLEIVRTIYMGGKVDIIYQGPYNKEL